jgi:menaquinone-dependent protoporphyrinogen IX oxidase
MFEIEYTPRNKGLLERIIYRLFPGLVEISPVKTDLKEYDVILFGIPVWGGRPSSPLVKYLKLCKNIYHKKIICFYIYGMEASAKSCAHYIEKTLKNRSRTKITNVFIPWSNVHDQTFLGQAIVNALSAIKQS